jgi:cytidylate kinase
MIILVCGYAASGKSMVSRYLGKQLKYKVVHTSDVLKQFTDNQKTISEKTKMNKGWYEKSNLMVVRKNDFSFDKNLDKYLLSLVKENENIVLDSSTLPYLLKKKKGVLKIWLKATHKTRAERMALRNKISLESADKVLRKKDKFNRAHYKKIYGFDFGKDLSVFNYILDTTNINIDQVFKKTLDFVKSKL